MSKRRRKLESSCNVNRKIQKEEVLRTNIQQIPNEMIMKIFSNLNDFKDIKSLISVSKRFRNLVFETSQCMMKIKIIFKNKIKQDEISQFLTEKGKSFKILEIQRNNDENDSNDPKLVPYILNQTSNLEEFIHEYNGKNCWLICDKVVKHPFNLPHLRRLTLAGDFWENFITNSRNLNKLGSLKLTRFDSASNEILTLFICEQENLKELCMDFYSSCSIQPFPSWDISNIIKFKLTNFEYSLRFSEKPDANLLKFLEMNSETIQELHLKEFLTTAFYEIIFGKCKNLKKLTLLPFNKFHSNLDDHSHWSLSDLEYFEIPRVDEQVFNQFFYNFPNLKTLKCGYFRDVNGTFEKLETLNVDIFHPIKNTKFPKLKNLFVNFGGMCYETFAQNTPNLENFDMETFDYEWSLSKILKNLKFFKNLKIFRASQNSNLQKVLINNVEKIVKLSSFFRRNENFCFILNTNFPGYEIVYSDNMFLNYVPPNL